MPSMMEAASWLWLRAWVRSRVKAWPGSMP